MKKNVLSLFLSVMKYLLIFTFLLTVSFTLVIANDSKAQEYRSVREVYLTIGFENKSLNAVFSEIEEETPYYFGYDNAQLDQTVSINIPVQRHSIAELLMEVARQSTLRFRQVNNNIDVIPVREKDKGSLEVLLKHTVTGRVTDENNDGLPGVSVHIKGTTVGTITNVDGEYSIDVPSGESVLIFSFVGMKTIEMVVGEKTVIDLVMEPDTQSLEEVVVVAYGEQRKISLVGAQSSVSIKELDQPVANISTMLAGRIAGITGVQRSGQPGYDGADIWIRGISTMNASRPLVLVDGVERSMNNIDPQDIESFSILKDASATAVYGVRGANGVILIETKEGTVGKPKVTLDYNQGITRFTQVPELMGGVNYMILANEALTTRGQAPRYSQEIIDKTANKVDPFVYPDVDWIDEVFREWGHNRNANLNVQGGSEKAQYYVSLGYYDETGLFNTDAMSDYNSTTRYTRYNVTTNVNLELTPTTKVDLGIQGYLATGNYPGESAATIYNSALEVNPVEYAVMYPGGFVPGRSPNGALRNPYAEATMRGYQNENKNQLYSNLRLTQDIVKGLKVSALFAFDAYNEHIIRRTKRKDTWIVDPANPRNPDGTLNLGDKPTFSGDNYLAYERRNGGNRRFYTELSINYSRVFGKHRLGGLLLGNRSDFSDAFAGDFTGSIPYRNQGFAARATYSYNDRYFAEVNVGYNGSENFAPSNRYGFFPAFGVGWVVSNENFFGPLKNTIDFLKIRYTDGKVGSTSGAPRFAYLGKLNVNARGFTFGRNRTHVNGIMESAYGVDVTWTESRKQDIGIEIDAFDSSLEIIFDVFKERREGAFLNRGDVPNFIGLNSDPSGNLGIVENKGFDGSVDYATTISQELHIRFRGTFSYNRNKILENDQPEQRYAWMEGRGRPVLARTGLIAERLFTLEDDVNGDGYITTDDGDEFAKQIGDVMPGDIKYADLNEDGLIDAYDRTQIGQGDVPALTYGFGTSVSYKGFDLSVFFQGQAEADIMLSGRGIMPFEGDGGGGNLFTAAIDRWTVENPNPDAMYPRLSYGSAGIGASNNTQASTWWIRNIDFLRLKTAEIGYTIPTRITDKAGIGHGRIYLRAVNPVTFSNFDLWDPELLTSNGARYPNITVYSLGLNLQF